MICVKSISADGALVWVCSVCNRPTGTAHRSLFRRAVFCADCCPKCGPKPATTKETTAVFPVWSTPSAPRPFDPWYRDDRRNEEASWLWRRRRW
ncbi:MAG: hypothetical protein ACLQPN_00720 [Bryobacteraceae bacterium]